MKRMMAWAAIAWVAMAGSVLADKPVIVVELFTSQGCSSCPPADAFLHKLAARDDVIALSLHVDYWDYIGWKDVFAKPQFTKRQQGYAHAGHRRSVYTPQMIIQGQDHVVGNHPMDVNDLIRRYQARVPVVDLNVQRRAGRVEISAAPVGGGMAPMLVQLVRFSPAAVVRIKRGENAGHDYSYANVVREWSVLGEWDGGGPLSIKAPLTGDLPAAVIVQRKGFGAVMAALRVE